MTRTPPDPIADAERAALSRALIGVAAQDRAALQEVYRRTSRKLFAICFRIFGDRADAEDAMQDVYLTIWHRAGSFDPARGNPVSWLATLTRNRAIDIVRRSGRRPTAPIDLAAEIPDGSVSAELGLLQQEADSRMEHCIASLAKSDATMIRTAFFEGATYADVATRAALPLATVKSRIRRALAKLRDCLS